MKASITTVVYLKANTTKYMYMYMFIDHDIDTSISLQFGGPWDCEYSRLTSHFLHYMKAFIYVQYNVICILCVLLSRQMMNVPGRIADLQNQYIYKLQCIYHENDSGISFHKLSLWTCFFPQYTNIVSNWELKDRSSMQGKSLT